MACAVGYGEMVTWLRGVLWIVALLIPGGFLLVPLLAAEAFRRRREKTTSPGADSRRRERAAPRGGRRRNLPERPLLPARPACDRGSRARRAARRHPRARARVRGANGSAPHVRARSAPVARLPPVARQRARA